MGSLDFNMSILFNMTHVHTLTLDELMWGIVESKS